LFGVVAVFSNNRSAVSLSRSSDVDSYSDPLTGLVGETISVVLTLLTPGVDVGVGVGVLLIYNTQLCLSACVALI